MPTIALVGDVWSRDDASRRLPFQGAAGYELTRQLEEAGVSRADCFFTTAFEVEPKPRADIEYLCVSKRECGHNLPFVKTGKYIRSDYLPQLDRLYRDLTDASPNIAVALGGGALWALTGIGGISKARGAVTSAAFVTGHDLRCKVLGTYHPAAVLRDYSLRSVAVLDLTKARRESAFPEIRRPERYVYIAETIDDIETFYQDHLRQAARISVDIETRDTQITCIGFAPDAHSAFVVPFVDTRRPGANYWPTSAAEVAAWEWVRRILDLPAAKVGQNFGYDMKFLWQGYRIPIRNVEHDTMLLSHAYMPEAPKGLGFLGSIYTNEASWKLMNRKGNATIKQGDD